VDDRLESRRSAANYRVARFDGLAAHATKPAGGGARGNRSSGRTQQ